MWVSCSARPEPPELGRGAAPWPSLVKYWLMVLRGRLLPAAGQTQLHGATLWCTPLLADCIASLRAPSSAEYQGAGPWASRLQGRTGGRDLVQSSMRLLAGVCRSCNMRLRGPGRRATAHCCDTLGHRRGARVPARHEVSETSAASPSAQACIPRSQAGRQVWQHDTRQGLPHSHGGLHLAALSAEVPGLTLGSRGEAERLRGVPLRRGDRDC